MYFTRGRPDNIINLLAFFETGAKSMTKNKKTQEKQKNLYNKPAEPSTEKYTCKLKKCDF